MLVCCNVAVQVDSEDRYPLTLLSEQLGRNITQEENEVYPSYFKREMFFM